MSESREIDISSGRSRSISGYKYTVVVLLHDLVGTPRRDKGAKEWGILGPQPLEVHPEPCIRS